MSDVRKQQENDFITVKKDRRFAYHIYPELSFDALPERLEELEIKDRRMVIVSDSNVAPLYLDELKEQIKAMKAEYEAVKASTPESMWLKDLQDFKKALG